MLHGYKAKRICRLLLDLAFKSAEQVREITAGAAGAVVGSAIVREIEDNLNEDGSHTVRGLLCV